MESGESQQESTILEEGAHALGLQLGSEQIQQLTGYLDLLNHWGRVHNLVGGHKRAEQIPRICLTALRLPPL